MLRTARSLCGDRTATLIALQAGDVSPEHAEVIVTVPWTGWSSATAAE